MSNTAQVRFYSSSVVAMDDQYPSISFFPSGTIIHSDFTFRGGTIGSVHYTAPGVIISRFMVKMGFKLRF